MTSHTPQLSRVPERRFDVIKDGVLATLLNKKLNDTAQNILWAEAVHICQPVIHSMATTGSTTSLFGNFYGEKPKIIGSFTDFGHIGYATKR